MTKKQLTPLAQAWRCSPHHSACTSVILLVSLPLMTTSTPVKKSTKEMLALRNLTLSKQNASKLRSVIQGTYPIQDDVFVLPLAFAIGLHTATAANLVQELFRTYSEQFINFNRTASLCLSVFQSFQETAVRQVLQLVSIPDNEIHSKFQIYLLKLQEAGHLTH